MFSERPPLRGAKNWTPRVRLVEIGAFLKSTGYSFITPTPLTHARVNRREQNAQARSLRDVFGWSRPFVPGLLPEIVESALSRADALEREDGLCRSRVRFSSLGEDLFVHSAYPTTAADVVFFGPDTYRFAALLKSALTQMPGLRVRRAVDIGCGSGAGGIALARCLKDLDLRVDLVDVNETALAYTRANLALAGLSGGETMRSDVLSGVEGSYDLIVANPPYLNDRQRRIYRHGGGAHGEALSIRIVEEALPRLNPGGR